MARWEYAHISSRQDPGEDNFTPRHWFWGPADAAASPIEADKFFAFVQNLGSDGWEMVGPPHQQRAVFSYQAANGTWHDRSYMVESAMWFKREA